MKHKLNPVMDAQLNRARRLRGHRRNLSDPRFSTSLTDSLGYEDEVSGSTPSTVNVLNYVCSTNDIAIAPASCTPVRCRPARTRAWRASTTR